MKKWYILFLCFVSLNRCQYPVDKSILPEQKRYLVVDADLSETYSRVNIQYSINDLGLNGAYGVPRRPGTMSAFYKDSKGNVIQIKKLDGTQDTTIHGKVGETYTLYVTADGNDYISTAETMRPCPDINNVTVQFSKETFRDPDDLYYNGFDVFSEANDIPNVENFYQWDWIHYEKAVSCAKRTLAEGEVQISCNPRDCWDITYNTTIMVQSDNLLDGKILSHRVARVPFINPPSKYYLKVEQRSITPNVYKYLQSLASQTQTVGTLFDLPPQTKFSPNIKNIKNEGESIIGVFNVFANRIKVVYIDMSQKIPNAVSKTISDPTPFASDPLLSAPCVEGTFRTKIKPIGWIE